MLLWKLAGPVVIPHIHRQCHALRIDHQAEFPPLWADAWLAWLLKPGKNGFTPADLRPISLTNSGGKVVAKTVRMQLQPQFRCSWPSNASRLDVTQACAQELAMEGLQLVWTVPRPLTSSTDPSGISCAVRIFTPRMLTSSCACMLRSHTTQSLRTPSARYGANAVFFRDAHWHLHCGPSSLLPCYAVLLRLAAPPGVRAGSDVR